MITSDTPEKNLHSLTDDPGRNRAITLEQPIINVSGV
jgi:hypothetical protein